MNKASVRLIPIIAATLALCSLWLVSTPVHADGLVAVVCPPIILPPGGPADFESWATPVMPPGAPPVRITPQPPAPPRPFTCPNYLSVKNHDVTVTIDNQVARTRIDETFLNDSGYELEGTYIFPLPDDATIGGLSMWVDGKKLEGRVLERNQARQIYEEIVRRQRDPALLEYVGRNAFKASIFPIPPQSEKRIRIEYSQVLTADNGLVRYVYPLDTTKFSLKPLASVSINVMVHSDNGLKAIYSPSHDVSIVRQGTQSAQVGFEASNVKPDRDFVLYYSLSQEGMGLNLLSYQSGVEDGFFALLVSPNSELQTTRVVDKDVLLVLDVSGSMQGAKIDQAKRALNYVLDHLNASDRFNIIAFSTGTSSFASSPRPVSERDAAKQFVNGLKAEGSTDINRALLEAASLADAKRPTLLVFLTDGLPTAGEVNSERILANAIGAVSPNVRLFTFGVGDDVNTVLLDSLAERFRGASGYIRPNEKIDEIVSAFYAKTSLPLLTDVAMNWGGITVGDVYPYPLPDLFAGGQLVVVGRYRAGGSTTLTLEGNVNGSLQSFRLPNVTFQRNGGDDWIPRLWATRKIGYLLNQVRLNGESREAVDEIVSLATRYGIVTPYTSFLIDERQDVLSAAGRGGAAQALEKSIAPSAMPTSGAAAVQHSQQQSQLQNAGTAHFSDSEGIKWVADKAFILRNGTWTDTQFDPTKMKTTKVEFGSEAYYAMADNADWARFLALGTRVIVVINGTAYATTDDGSGATSSAAPTAVPIAPTVDPQPSSTPASAPVAAIASPAPIPLGDDWKNRAAMVGGGTLVLAMVFAAVRHALW